MWSKLLDEKGRERASIFYKAAFYDRDAFLNLRSRYQYGSTDPDGNYGMDRLVGYAKENGAPAGEYLFKTDVVVTTKANQWDESDRLKALGKAWLDEHIPAWADPVKSWTWDQEKGDGG